LCVKTNIGYSVVGEFIVLSESAEDIQEALSVLQEWNTSWKPQYVMVDYCKAEIETFTGCCVYICDFHREQAWERWVRDKKHQLTESQGQQLLCMLRQCVNAPPSSPEQTLKFKEAVSVLKNSDLWKLNHVVREWLINGWQSIPHVCKWHIFCMNFMYFILGCAKSRNGTGMERNGARAKSKNRF